MGTEELAARYIVLVNMSKEEFSGHEQELGDINAALWDGHDKDAVIHIENARQAYALLGG